MMKDQAGLKRLINNNPVSSSGSGPAVSSPDYTTLIQAINQNTLSMNELKDIIAKRPYPDRPRSRALEIETENITRGTQNIIGSLTLPPMSTNNVADCRSWRWISVAMQHFSSSTTVLEIYIQIKGGLNSSTANGIDIGEPIVLLQGESTIVNLTEDDWAPYIYATIYAPWLATLSTFRIDVIKRR